MTPRENEPGERAAAEALAGEKDKRAHLNKEGMVSARSPGAEATGSTRVTATPKACPDTLQCVSCWIFFQPSIVDAHLKNLSFYQVVAKQGQQATHHVTTSPGLLGKPSGFGSFT